MSTITGIVEASFAGFGVFIVVLIVLGTVKRRRDRRTR